MPDDKVVVQRLTITFPEDLWEKIDGLAKKEKRSVPNLIIKVFDDLFQEEPVKKAQEVAEQSPEYKTIIERLDRIEKRLPRSK